MNIKLDFFLFIYFFTLMGNDGIDRVNHLDFTEKRKYGGKYTRAHN